MADFVLLVIGMNLLCSMLLCDGVFWIMCQSDGRHGEKLLKKWDFHILDLLGYEKCKKKAYIILCWWWKNAHLTSKFCGFAGATPWLPFFAEWQSKHPGVAATGWSPSDTHVSHCTSVVVLWSHWSGSLLGHTVLMTQSGHIYIYLYFSSSWVFCWQRSWHAVERWVETHNILQSLKSPHFVAYKHILYRCIL